MFVVEREKNFYIQTKRREVDKTKPTSENLWEKLYIQYIKQEERLKYTIHKICEKLLYIKIAIFV